MIFYVRFLVLKPPKELEVFIRIYSLIQPIQANLPECRFERGGIYLKLGESMYSRKRLSDSCFFPCVFRVM